MILGISCAVLLLFTSSLFFTRKLSQTSHIRRIANAVHVPLGGALIALSATHLLLSLKLFHQRPLAMVLLGFALMMTAVLASLTKRLFRKNPRRGYRVHLICALTMTLLLAGHVALGIGSFSQYQREMAAVSVETLSVHGVPDGVYDGACDVGYIRARVRVTVADGKIMNIDLVEHRNERGAAGEGVIQEILSAQALPVDTVSGATNSSLVIQKAVENALAGLSIVTALED